MEELGIGKEATGAAMVQGKTIGLVPVFVRKLVHMIQEASFDRDKHLLAFSDSKIIAATII